MKTAFLLLFPLIVSISSGNFSSISPSEETVFIPYQNHLEEVDGEKIYKKKCKWCHGREGDKTKKNVASLVKSQLMDDEKTDVVRNGRGSMPPFGEMLNEAEIDAVITYIGTFARP